ncbi:uncharacterized protein EI90DRAFT_2926732 [Cantharellus anzutake]|uniref:uncharacterized protein n=1 Tax=Cantharellus anzutake TaxID=1750568 RepID=UPI001904E810|nr:uncharacterized protein EI90DRAFT_2926732 [Cantharellus anzutake]KAF8328121.1 hypothetical protein EI90DRAFT_2926732 [Cantharellus anzutake]
MSRSSHRTRLLTFIGTAVASGIVFHLLLLGLGAVPTGGTVVEEWWGRPKPGPVDAPSPTDIVTHQPPSTGPCSTDTAHPYTRPGLGQYITPDEDEWTLERIRTMVSKTKGYYARDYSLGLGWNNMRYIVEASVLHAHLLNRTLVLPSFVYARACEHNITVCAAFAIMVNRGDAIGWGEWRELPIEKQMGWRIPIDIMLDLDHLRKDYSVITVSEYLKLHNMDPDKEWSNGAWQREAYHDTFPKPSLAVIPNNEYDPSGVIRVDKLQPAPEQAETTIITTSLMNVLDKNSFSMRLDDAEKALVKNGLKSWTSEKELEELLEKEGWAILHTFAGYARMDFLKSTVEPLKQITRREFLKGLVDDYDHLTEDVLLLEGETHLSRKPGALRFTTPEARAHFADLVLHSMRPIPSILKVTDIIAERMRKVNDGRMWLAGHMRRGDFVRLGWSMEGPVEKHLERIKEHLSNGGALIRQLIKDGVHWGTYDVPNVKPDEAFGKLEPPRVDDKFYIATDERDPEALKYIREHGAILISDLLTPEDRRLVGWPLLVTDVLALLEQNVMSHAAYFYAHAMSSVAGGVVNLRAARGMDPRLTLID